MNAFGDFESLYEENNKLNNLLFLITQKFKNQNDDYLSREKYLKIFLIKIASTNQTLINSYKSIKINVNNKNAEIIDYPSIFLLSRAILETYLTMEYLYFNELSDEEKDFRFKLWRMSGFMLRQNALKEFKDYSELLIREKEEIEKAKSEIKESKYYWQINEKLWQLDKFGIPRILSWIKIIENSKLRTKLFSGFYQLYSNYAHSEFLSMMQLYSIGYNPTNEVLNMSKSSLIIANSVLSHCMKNLTSHYESAKNIFENFDENSKSILTYWFENSKE